MMFRCVASNMFCGQGAITLLSISKGVSNDFWIEFSFRVNWSLRFITDKGAESQGGEKNPITQGYTIHYSIIS